MKIIIADLKHFLSDALFLIKFPVNLKTNWNLRTLLISVLIVIMYVSVSLADQTAREFFSKFHIHFFDFLFNVGHLYGKLYLTAILFVSLYSAGFVLKNEKIRKNGFRIFETFIFAGIIVTIFKSLFGRWRPYTNHGNFAFDFLNFGSNNHLSLPSGDVAVAFAFTIVVANFFQNKIWKVFWYLLAVLTAFGRIYHDQHWLSDVILGAVLSTIIGIIINKKSKEEVVIINKLS
ncbi:MAG: hypothetical protein A2057_14765 [Ignavibacteria bacterium GWA2_35_9]|nr:MAG: hypothetical protein A2057_14765 [Ignavibacteria bacterium GWA2_35_9]OGU46793.1 MAG: hypothetical protein A2000_04800 [Ignavibacteria bacterium GWB2_36_8]OGU48058.1 MAG: hypothetical protein A2080_07645 [Ignavibacteria bacterium GWC2_36_12]